MTTAGTDLQEYPPHFLFAHDLINKLSVVVGHCDLLKNHAPADLECQRRLAAIREIASGMATQLADYQRQVDVVTREMQSNKLAKAANR